MIRVAPFSKINKPNDHSIIKKFSVIFLGDQSVGKTSIIYRYLNSGFNKNLIVYYYYIQTTLGIDSLTKTIEIGKNIIRLQLWDTAGQERFKCIIPSYIKKACVAIIVYDITSIINIY